MKVMSRRNLSPTFSVIVLTSAALGGCSLVGAGDPEPTINVKQAVKRVDSVLDENFKVIHPRLKWRDDAAHMSERRSSITNQATGEVRVGRTRYVRTKVSKGKLTELLAVVRKHWAKEGFKVSEVDPRNSLMSGKSSNGCIVNFSVNGFGAVEISASFGALSAGRSGDIEGEEGDTFPKAPDGGPDYTPDVRDPYWSK
ncbi:hypothetical protein [Streptomyces lydicus]|uniref:hypothetical protein n=1 Tax=Streptomyces lydicus TaxID=47763 RepID=UPI0037982C10